MAPAIGHIYQAQKNKLPKNHLETDEMEDAKIINKGKITNLVLAVIEHMGTPGRIYTDQNGRFPVTYTQGTKYAFVLYF